MKKRIFLLFCGVMCLLLLLCSCTDEAEESGLSIPSGNNTVSSLPTTPNGGNIPDSEPTVFPPETACPANELGHYWKDISISNSTSSTVSVIIKGSCYNCGQSLGKEAVSVVDFDEWKNALSSSGLSSFTLISGGEYTDFDENNTLSWRIKNNIYTQDFSFSIEQKNSAAHALNFAGFSLAESFNKFKYDSNSRTYVYSDENAKYELGFADGHLLLHSVESLADENNRVTSLYVNHGRIKIDVPDYVKSYFSNMTSCEALSKSKESKNFIEKLNDALSEMSFDMPAEISYLENGKVSFYFILDEEKTDPFFDLKYSTVSVLIENDAVVRVSFGSNDIELSY